MHALRFLLICTLVFACACARAQRPQEAERVTSEGAHSTAKGVSGPTQALGEFESLTPTDVELYLKVMRTAADRLKSLSSTDREALNAFRSGKLNPKPGQTIPTEQMAAVSRASELMNLDTVVAKEMGVAKRYRSISARIPELTMGPMAGEGETGDEARLSEEQKRAQKMRFDRIQQRKKLDDAILAPHRDEILSLQKQVHLLYHPESIPK